MATTNKDYSTFDFDEELKKRQQSNDNSDSSDYGNFDFDDYFKRQNLPKVGEYLDASIHNWIIKNKSFYNSNINRYSNENPSYRSDASDWLSTVTTRKDELEKEASEIRTWLDQYKDYFNEDYYNSVVNALDGNIKGYGNILSAATEDHKFWSNFETEDAYKKWLTQQEEEKKKLSFDLTAGQAEIDDVQKALDEFTKLNLQIVQRETAYAQAGMTNPREMAESDADLQGVVARINELSELYGVDARSGGLKSLLSEKKAYYTQAERAQKAKELASVADEKSENYDIEFDKYAELGNHISYENIGDTTKKNGITIYDDLKAATLALNEHRLGQELYTEDMVTPKSGIKGYFEGLKGLSEYNTENTETVNIFRKMNENEFNTLAYYLQKDKENNSNLAEQYVDSLKLELNTRLAGDIVNDKDTIASKYLFAIEAGLDQWFEGRDAMFSGEDYIVPSAKQFASGTIRDSLKDTGAELPDWLGDGTWGQTTYDLLNTGANMLPTILASTAVSMIGSPVAGKVVGAGLMGLSAGGNAKAEMLNLGYSKEQANSYGVMVAAAEAGMEYLLGSIPGLSSGDGIFSSLGVSAATKVDNAIARVAIKLGNKGTSILKAVANGAIKITAGALDETLEESLQTVIEPWLKEIATGVDWEDPKIDEILYSGLLGALSSVALGGIGNVAGEVGTYRSGKKIQKIDGGVERLQKLGQTFSADTVAYKIAGKVNAQTDAYTIGRLLNEVGATISEQNLTEIVNGLTAKGMGIRTANTIAKQYQAFLNNEMRMTDEQVKILENLSPLADVLRTNIIGSNTTVYQRTRAYSDLMNLADEVSNRKKGDVSKTETTEKTTSPISIFEQNDINAEMKRLATEVATGSRMSASERAIKRQVDSASETAADRLGVEGRYTSSDTGATRLASNKKRVNIVGVDSIEDGVMNLKLNDGSVVSADDIDFSTSDEALVYEAVANMRVNANTAWEILKGYDPKSNQKGTIYAMGALEAYTYGHNGVKVEGMSQDGFSALLSPVQKNTANRLGDIDARAKVDAQQKTIDKAVKSVRDEAKSKHKAIPKRKGEVVFEGKIERLTDLQKSQIDVLEPVAKGLGVTFHIFESDENFKYTMPDGAVRSANGWYDPKTGEIWIDIKAGNFGQGTIIFTAAHELTHFIRQWSPAKFKIFADFLFEQYGKKGQDVNQLVQRQIEKATAKNRTIGWDEAYEEVVADSCETFLRDSKAAEKIAALREKDVGLANKIKTFLGQMLAKMRKVMADLGLAPETPEGQMVAEMTDSLQKLYDLWTDALADAGTAYSTLAEIDFDTDSVAPMLSERTWTASEYVTEREETAKKIAKALDVDMKTAYKYIDDINSVARLIADDRARLDYEPNLDDNATVLKPNSEYKYSVDMSTLCAKRLLFTGTFDAIQRALPNTVFDSEDIVALREMMQDRGYEVACGICYVESTRREIGRITQEFIDRYKVAQKTGKPISRINSSGKEVVLKSAGKTFNADKNYTPNLGELNTTDIDIVKRDHREVYDAYLAFMNARGQAKPKLLETRAEYKGEILKHFKAKSAVEARNNAGGLRLQSFSDFEVPHLIDMMQIVMDMSRVGLKSQAYTKVPAFAEVFGGTGVKINLSLIAKGDGLDANGNLVFDDVEGINHKEAFKLRDKYSKNVGTILVGKTDAHIIAAMADPRIDYIIPFHKSSWKESLYDALGLTGYADYTDYQNEKPIDKDRKIKNFDPSEYWDFSKSGDENAQIYLAKCREDGRIPKFPQFQGYPGYWKLLIDFKMYDNDGVGSPQEVVKPEFNTEASERILSEYKGGHKSFPVAKDVVEDFVKEHKDTAKYSDRVTDKKTLDFLENQEHVTVYRAMQVIDGKLYPPMNAYTYDDNGKKVLMPPSEIGAWEQSVERPDLIDPKTGKFKLDKGKVDSGKRGTAVPAAYNPYIHTSLSMLNDQFTSAYQRSNLVVVKGVVPKSELTSGYHAQYAKDSVGETEWHSGVVSTQLPKSRKVILSRWFKPVEIISNDDVAESIKEMLTGTDIEIPYNVVSPGLRRSLEKIGVPIGEGRGIKGLPKKDEVKYSDRTSYAPTFYSHMGKVIDGIKLAKMGAGGVVSYLKGKGVKNEEIKWSGIETFLEGKKSVTKEELQEFVAGSQLKIIEQMPGETTYVDEDLHSYTETEFKEMAYEIAEYKGYEKADVSFENLGEGLVAFVGRHIEENEILSAEKEEGGVRWGQYKLDGGTNYREIVFQMPNSTYTNSAMEAHWGDEAEGVLAHARIQDMTTSDGKKMLFIEEIQSDWHNEGHQKGYVDDSKKLTVGNTELRHEGKWYNLYHDGKDMHQGVSEEYLAQRFRNGITEDQIHEGLVEEYNRAMAKSKNGVELVPDAPFRDTYHEYVLKRLIRMAAEEGYDSIGWTTADIQSKRWSEDYAEGYRIEYDQDIPKFLRKYGKKWGATVGKVMLDQGYTHFDLAIEAERENLAYWQNELATYPESDEFIRSQINYTEESLKKLQATGETVWSMDIPDSMKDSVLYEGQVMYSDRTDIVDVDGKEYDHVIELEYKTFKKVSRRGSAYINFIRSNLINKKITVYNSNGDSEVIEFAKNNERVRKDGSKNFKRVLGELEQARNEIKKLVILNAVETAKISQFSQHETENSHQWLDANGWDTRISYVMSNNGIIYPVELHIAKTKDGRNILYDVNVKINEGIGIDKIATSLRSKKIAKQAVKVPKPSTGALYHKKANLSSGKNKNNPHSDRSTGSVSTRSLLANALETTAQNDIERNKLEQYKNKIDLIESEQEKLTKLKAEIKALSFAKGSRDTARIKQLQFEANQTANRINVYDRQLLNLESTTALKNVLNREKELARRKEAQKGKEALARQKERQAKTIRTLMDKNTESKKNAIERRDKTAMRRMIHKVVKDLNSLLKNGTKQRNIKQELQSTVATSLAFAEIIFNDDFKNEDIVRLGVDSVTEQESILLNEYRDLLDKRDELLSKIDSTYANGLVREDLLAKVGSIEEELAKVKNRISTLNSKLSEVFERERARLNRATMDSVIDALITEYSKLGSSETDYIRNAFSETVKTRLETLKNDLQGTIAKDMDIYQLAEVYDAFKMVKHMVTTANGLFREGRTEDLMTYVSNVQGEIYEATTEQKDRGLIAEKIVAMLNEFSWNNLRPVDAMERLGSETFEKLFWDYIHAMGVAAMDIVEAGEVIASAREKYGYSKWNMELADTSYTTREGKTFKPSLADKMAIYAYSKREGADGNKQAMKHMVDGGFVYDTGRTYKEKESGKTYVRRKLSYTYRLSEGNINSIISSLTKEQRDYVDAILPYLTDMGKKGNEVSMTLYGIELFGEKIYFPLQSSSDYLSSTTQELGATPTMSSLANSGFTKQTKPGANNPIVLRGFDDVVLDHIEKMSNYHALVIPIENLRRVFDNVGKETEGMPISTKALIGSRFGTEAQKYFAQWLTDINGGISPSGAKSPLGKLFSRAKGTSVAANLSVVAQQYFSIARAMELVDAKYFIPFLNSDAKKTDIKQYEELLKYAPIAIIKDMNGFDVGSSGRVKDYIGYEGARKDAKYLKKKADDLWMWGAGQMDKLGWVTIWKAVKAEVASEQKLTPGTDKFFDACRIRFTEVVTKTQVFDSVATRSGYMRSQHDAVKYATSYMGEPTTIVGRIFGAVNTLVRAIKSKDKTKIKSAAFRLGRVATVVAVSNVLGKLAQSLVYGGRDDEEDEAFLERWMRNFAEALADDLKPYGFASYLPFGRDVVSLIEGYSVERPDMALIEDIIKSLKGATDGDLTLDDSLNIIGSVGNFFGQPLKNIIREIKAAINVIGDVFDDIHPTDIGGAFVEGITGEERTKKESLYTAIIRGDEGKIQAIRETYESDKAYKTAVKSALRENDPRIKKAAKEYNLGNVRSFSGYVEAIASEGHFDRETIESAIRSEQSAFNTKINEAAEAKTEGKDEEYKKIVRELRDSYRGIYSQDDIVNLVKKAQEEQLATEDDEETEEATSIYKASDINLAFENGDTDMALEVIDDLFNTKVENYLAEARKEAEENGKRFNENTARKEAEKKAKSSIRSSMTTYWKPLYKKAYKSKNTAEQERIKKILKESGIYGNAHEVIKTIQEWRTERD